MSIVGLKSARKVRLFPRRRFLSSPASPLLLACLTLAFEALLKICHKSFVPIASCIELQCCLLRSIPVFDLLPVVVLAVDHIGLHQPFVLLTLRPETVVLFWCGLNDRSLFLHGSFLLT